MTSLSEYARTGIHFLREHTQLWVTALLAIIISTSFVYVSLRFATVAGDAQEQLFNDRTGWLLDSFVLFAGDTLADRNRLRAHMRAVVDQNPTIEQFLIVQQVAEAEFQVVADPLEASETMRLNDPRILDSLLIARQQHAHTMFIGSGGERRILTVRALTTPIGVPKTVALVILRMSEADRVIAQEIRTSYFILSGLLCIILILFFRHARIVDFATLYKKQIEIDQMKDSFLSMASHELKSPLSVIRGYIEYLEDEGIEKSQRAEFLRRIKVSADELRQLIDDILDVSRIEMGRLRFSPDYVKPSEVVGEVLDMFKMTASEKGIALVYTPNEEDAADIICVDRGRLKQVTINLMSNALKYTLKGTITVTTTQVGDSYEIAVRDTGVGMTEEERSKLFGKFYRVEAEETKGVRGTGLGLWITKYLTEHMNGTISVESIKGEGSRFVLRFPLHRKRG